MRRRLAGAAAWLALVAALASCAPDEPTTDSALMNSLAGRKLLFLGAHPDDEWVLMPILAEACLFRDASCHFVSTTAGEVGCFETLRMVDLDACAELRTREFSDSAAIARGSSEILGWPDLFYAHDGDGLRRGQAVWEEQRGGRDSLVGEILGLLRREAPDVVFGLDPRHGSTCNPNHRATSLLLAEAVRRLPVDERPRVLFENTFSVFEAMDEDVVAAVDRGAMFPWPSRDDPNLFYDGARVLPDGSRAIDVQLASLRAHASQFPELPADASIEADPSQLQIPLLDLADIDISEELCSPLDLSEYKTSDVTLEYIGRVLKAQARDASGAIALRLRYLGKTVTEHGDLESSAHRLESDFPGRAVRLVVGANNLETAELARARALRLLEPFLLAPD
ncbi:MAG: PIG-L family deacetylase [Acidobacteriota bacterium]